MTFKKQYILFTVLAIFAFGLIFPKISLADYCSQTCPEIYKTDCEEEIEIGCCELDCCIKVCIATDPLTGECIECDCEKECIHCNCNVGMKWPEYKCTTPDCEEDILVRWCEVYKKDGPCIEADCPGEESCINEYCCVHCDEPEICEECQSWQKPIREPPCDDCTKWGLIKPECFCDGECIGKPQHPRYYNSPLYPKDECNAEQELLEEGGLRVKSGNVYLPVKLDWDDIEGWNRGWKENGECKQVIDCKSGDKACYEAPSDSKFDQKSSQLRQCKKECWGSCYAKVGEAITNGYWLAPYQIPEFYKTCVKDCEDVCQSKYTTTAAGCLVMCPTAEGVKDKCYLQPEGYIQSYVIKIEGEMRDCEALRKIDELEKKIEKAESAAERKEYEEEIKRIKKEELEMNEYLGASSKSEFIPPCSCMLKSNQTYTWKVRACCPTIVEIITKEELLERCGPNCCPEMLADLKEELKKQGVWVEDDLELEEVCGPWSDWESITDEEAGEICWGMYGRECTSCEIRTLKEELKNSSWKFITSPAPEPKLPYDPDWAGFKKGENVPKEYIEKLKWCEIDDSTLYHKRTLLGETYYRPLSYELLMYYSKEELVEEKMPLSGLSDYDLCHPQLEVEGVCEEKIVSFNPDLELFPQPQFWDINNIYFTKITPYAWQVAACEDLGSVNCPYAKTDLYSQLWRFEAEEFTLDKPWLVLPLNDPDGKNPVGLPVIIQWASPYAMSSNYEIKDLDRNQIVESGKTKYLIFNITLDYPQLDVDTRYSWKVQPCWDFEAEECEDFWSETFYFKTGASRINFLYPPSDAVDVLIPVYFDWEDVPGTKSYRFRIQGGDLDLEEVVNESEAFLDYPDLRQDTEYLWQVAACAHREGEACGEYGSQKFKTIKLAPPTNPQPEGGTTVLTTQPHTFSWDKVLGAHYYQFKIAYINIADDEVKKECSQFEETKNVSENRIYYPLECKGEYQWQVRGCIDKNCQEAGEWSNWSLSLVSEKKKEKIGLIPCGRKYDIPPEITPWDETDPCGIKDIFIMTKIIIDFLILRLVPIFLVLLLMASAIIFYLSLGGLKAQIQVRSIWKAAGIGFGIILFAWLIVSLILNIMGYQVGVFGAWWQIPI